MRSLILFVCLAGCVDRPPVSRGHASTHGTVETQAVTAQAEPPPATPPSATPPPATPPTPPPPPRPPPPNSADAVTPSSITWRWRSEGVEHRLFIRRRGDARCDVDGLACQPRGRLQDASGLFDRLDRLIGDAFPSMQAGSIPADVSGDFQGVQVVLANATSRHALITNGASAPPGVQALVDHYVRLLEAPETFSPAP